MAHTAYKMKDTDFINTLDRLIFRIAFHKKNKSGSKKYTIGIQLSWCLIKMISSWVGKFGKITVWLDEKCNFFSDRTCFSVLFIIAHTLLEGFSFIQKSNFEH